MTPSSENYYSSIRGDHRSPNPTPQETQTVDTEALDRNEGDTKVEEGTEDGENRNTIEFGSDNTPLQIEGNVATTEPIADQTPAQNGVTKLRSSP